MKKDFSSCQHKFQVSPLVRKQSVKGGEVVLKSNVVSLLVKWYCYCIQRFYFDYVFKWVSFCGFVHVSAVPVEAKGGY